jgi:hypothetical protein
MSEALPTHYQASNTHHHILTAVRARCWVPLIRASRAGDPPPTKIILSSRFLQVRVISGGEARGSGGFGG